MVNSKIHPPRGIARLVWRFPIALYRMNLGWLLTDHFLLLNHIGRKSGQVRQAVVEVVKYDAERDVYYIAAGFGTASDWFQNILKTPQINIQCGKRKTKVVAEILPKDEVENILADYERRHPTALRNLAKVIGYEMKNGSVDFHAFSQIVPIVALKVIKQVK
jgi:deazaflavin-dependent oxidoreductase (nitroreductase family)